MTIPNRTGANETVVGGGDDRIIGAGACQGDFSESRGPAAITASDAYNDKTSQIAAMAAATATTARP